MDKRELQRALGKVVVWAPAGSAATRDELTDLLPLLESARAALERSPWAEDAWCRDAHHILCEAARHLSLGLTGPTSDNDAVRQMFMAGFLRLWNSAKAACETAHARSESASRLPLSTGATAEWSIWLTKQALSDVLTCDIRHLESRYHDRIERRGEGRQTQWRVRLDLCDEASRAEYERQRVKMQRPKKSRGRARRPR